MLSAHSALSLVAGSPQEGCKTRPVVQIKAPHWVVMGDGGPPVVAVPLERGRETLLLGQGGRNRAS